MPENEGFLQWFMGTYGEDEFLSWLQRWGKVSEYWGMSKEHKEWVSAGSPGIDVEVPETGFVPPEYPGDANVEDTLNGIKTLDDLYDTLSKWVKGGIISQQDSKDLWDTQALRIAYLSVPEATKADLQQFTSEAELAKKISKLGLDKQVADTLYTGILEGMTGLDVMGMGEKGAISEALEGARGQVSSQTLDRLTKEYTAPNKMYLADEVERVIEREKQQFQGEIAKIQEANEIGGLFERVRRNPSVDVSALSQVKKLYDTMKSSPYQEGLGEEIYRRLTEIDRQAQQQAKIDYLKGPSGTNLLPGEYSMRDVVNAREENVLAGIQARGVPSGQGIVDRLTEGAGYAPGTRLESFIRGELGRSAQTPEMRERRQRWWAGVTSGSRGTTPQAYAYSRLLASPELNPSEVGGILSPDYAPVFGDPLYSAYNKEEMKRRYFRQPGAGLVNRLTPSVRFR